MKFRFIFSVLVSVSIVLTSVKATPSTGFFSQSKYDKLMSLLKNTQGDMYTLGGIGEATNVAAQTERLEGACSRPNAKIQVRQTISDGLKMWALTCSPSELSTIEALATVTEDEDRILDLQVFDIASTESPKRNLVRDLPKLALAITVATLAAGLLASGTYPHQVDKLKHALLGTLTAFVVTITAYYGFQLSPKQSMIVGVATTIALALAKEHLYDKRHRGIHTVDTHDAVATSYGALGAFAVVYSFSF